MVSARSATRSCCALPPVVLIYILPSTCTAQSDSPWILLLHLQGSLFHNVVKHQRGDSKIRTPINISDATEPKENSRYAVRSATPAIPSYNVHHRHREAAVSKQNWKQLVKSLVFLLGGDGMPETSISFPRSASYGFPAVCSCNPSQICYFLTFLLQLIFILVRFTSPHAWSTSAVWAI